MNRFKLKTIKPATSSIKKSEKELNDLLKILPTTKQYGVDGEISKKIKRLRDGRKQRHITLELSRDWISYDKTKDVTEKKVLKVNKNELKYDGGDHNAGNRPGGRAYFEAISFEQPFEFISERKLLSDKLVLTAPLVKKSSASGEPITFTQTLAKLKEQLIEKVKKHRADAKLVVPEHTYREGLTVRRFEDNVHIGTKDILKLMHKKVRFRMKDSKSPGDKKDLYVGVEFEFACTEGQDKVADVLFEAGIGKHVQVKRDGSIKLDVEREGRVTLPGQFAFGIEINIIGKQSEINELVTKACDAINANLTIRVDKSCGFHVHLDMRNRDVAKSYYNLASMQHFLFAMNPSARLTGTYSVPVGRPTAEFIPSGNHYDGVSSNAYTKYKTLEMRMHCGTTQAVKINNWINFLIALADAPKLEGIITSTKRLQQLCGLSEELTNYVEGRIAKFYKQHVKLKDKYAMLSNVEEVATAPDTFTEETSEVA